ncbi:MAG: Pseudouridine synthase [Candidatus Curtissbacteria bacterium GW2011_GWA1_40_16]|uniref:Pseudouridine synthase n=1 Tax=Candidatus Curtissbacteria bacterium GW2011_GWA1_40_16 TaxID=1618405 RepID=A0A0G0UMA6_9BACT|nr:MAG: Pseudouridine synthase [Candidatus Curtissbacteria bacterium GW2011_GWA1_40_16]
MRINKYLASIGIASRRKVDELIGESRVKINGKTASLGDHADPQKDIVEVDGRKVGEKEKLVYIALNKPEGYTSTAAHIKGEKSVLELIKSSVRLYPVGRLDKDSTGLILLTNDGELAQKLTHPKFHIPKTYEVKVLGSVSKTQIEMMEKGIKLEEGATKPAKVQIKSESLPHHSILEITLYEGKKRQIRRMLATLHLHVLELKRTSVGPVKIGNLQVGKYRTLTEEELFKL